MLPFNKKTVISRMIFVCILGWAAFFAPFWIFLVIGGIGVILFPWYAELIFFLYIRESLFIFDTKSLLCLLGFSLLIGVMHWFRGQIRL